MDCREHDSWLERLAVGETTAVERTEAARHRETCASCRELHELVSTEPAGEDRATDVVDSVLARTSGEACSTALGVLAPYVDGELDGLDRDLVRAHVERCRDCEGAARVLARMGADLEALAEVAPDARFVTDVVARTSGRRGWRETLVSTWERWSRRPRLAWEVAYIATMLFALVFGATGRSVAEVPRAVAGLVSLDLERPVDRIETGIQRGVRGTLHKAGSAVVEPSRECAARVLGAIESSFGTAYDNVGTFVRRLASFGADEEAPAGSGTR